MNDYERAALTLHQTINNLEAISGTDPDIDEVINGAVDLLTEGHFMAEDRS